MRRSVAIHRRWIWVYAIVLIGICASCGHIVPGAENPPETISQCIASTNTTDIPPKDHPPGVYFTVRRTYEPSAGCYVPPGMEKKIIGNFSTYQRIDNKGPQGGYTLDVCSGQNIPSDTWTQGAQQNIGACLGVFVETPVTTVTVVRKPDPPPDKGGRGPIK